MVYLIHFSQKLHHAQHYIGFVEDDLVRRIELHLSNRGAKLLAAVNNNGISWQVVRIWMDVETGSWSEGSRTTKSPGAFAQYAVVV